MRYIQNNTLQNMSVAAKMIAVGAVLGISILFAESCVVNADYENTPAGVEAMYQESRKGFPDAPDISIEELMEKAKAGKLILVDNRKPEEQEVSMIPGAVTSREFDKNPEKYRDSAVIVYCTIGHRSGYYTLKLREQGIDAYNLKGGTLAWAHAGEKFEDSNGNETNRAHVYGAEWNLLPEGYEAVW